jgi:hypothetical protein
MLMAIPKVTLPHFGTARTVKGLTLCLFIAGSENYNPRTLQVPKSAWDRFTPFEKQYWEIKCKHWDTVSMIILEQLVIIY